MNNKLFNEMISGFVEAKKYRAGKKAKMRVSRVAFAPVSMKPAEIRRIRTRLRFSQPEFAEFKVAEAPRDVVAAGIEVPRPLPEGQVIAPAIVVDDIHLEIRLPQLVKEIVEHQEGMIAGIDVAHHEGR